MASCTEVLTRKPKNIAVATNPAHELNVLESDVPEPGSDDCLVHVRATGICGSDVHFWKAGNIGDSVITKDCGLGHESAGVVVGVGRDVTGFQVGMSLQQASVLLILCVSYRRSLPSNYQKRSETCVRATCALPPARSVRESSNPLQK